MKVGCIFAVLVTVLVYGASPRVSSFLPLQTSCDSKPSPAPISHVLFSFIEAGEKEKCEATETLCTRFMKRKSVASSVVNKTLEGKIKGKGR